MVSLLIPLLASHAVVLVLARVAASFAAHHLLSRVTFGVSVTEPELRKHMPRPGIAQGNSRLTSLSSHLPSGARVTRQPSLLQVSGISRANETDRSLSCVSQESCRRRPRRS